jgi:hypothetical protein
MPLGKHDRTKSGEVPPRAWGLSREELTARIIPNSTTSMAARASTRYAIVLASLHSMAFCRRYATKTRNNHRLTKDGCMISACGLRGARSRCGMRLYNRRECTNRSLVELPVGGLERGLPPPIATITKPKIKASSSRG